MKKSEKGYISIVKIICISLVFLFLSCIGVMAVTTKINTVNISLSNGYEMTVMTSKTKVSEILQDNNILVQEDELVTPNLDEEITEGKTIKIKNKSIQEVKVAQISENGIETSLEQLLENYAPITEKIVVEEVEIPFETITKNTVADTTNTTNRVVQEGQNGIKRITYKAKYKNNEEIERTVLSEEIVKEPVNKIVQVNKAVTSRSSTKSRKTTEPVESTQSSGGNATTVVCKVTAYCPTIASCGKTDGITASGKKARANHTIAASSKYKFGTKIKINGIVYTVEDRGGAVKGNTIDIYFNTHAEAVKWGVKYLPVEILQ